VPDTSEAELLPLFLKLEGRDVLVVGAGAVAERKIEALLEARARVRVVAPTASAAVQEWARLGRLAWTERAFEDANLEGAWLVVAATSNAAVQQSVAAAAERRRVFCLAVDDPAHASAYSGAVVRRPPFAIAISSGGASPALTRLVREIVEHVLPGDEWVEHARRLRARWQADGTPMADRFAELVRELEARARPRGTL
jgi:uroporphyrin-III C-methyltransferase/precorrin-2 dehydrogenase/sirohydrochlorin ferrochelatase